MCDQLIFFFFFFHPPQDQSWGKAEQGNCVFVCVLASVYWGVVVGGGVLIKPGLSLIHVSKLRRREAQTRTE